MCLFLFYTGSGIFTGPRLVVPWRRWMSCFLVETMTRHWRLKGIVPLTNLGRKWSLSFLIYQRLVSIEYHIIEDGQQKWWFYHERKLQVFLYFLKVSMDEKCSECRELKRMLRLYCKVQPLIVSVFVCSDMYWQYTYQDMSDYCCVQACKACNCPFTL